MASVRHDRGYILGRVSSWALVEKEGPLAESPRSSQSPNVAQEQLPKKSALAESRVARVSPLQRRSDVGRSTSAPAQ
jgi:hypothetical protein